MIVSDDRQIYHRDRGFLYLDWRAPGFKAATSSIAIASASRTSWAGSPKGGPWETSEARYSTDASIPIGASRSSTRDARITSTRISADRAPIALTVF